MIYSQNETERIFYQTCLFVEGVVVTGYLINPDTTTSLLQTFTEIGDGVYYLDVQIKRLDGFQDVDKFGLVVKENGVTKKFETIVVEN